jgi:hypothetical protein
MDFLKRFDDENLITEEETLQDYFDFILKIERGESDIKKPIITFKKVKKGPESSMKSYSRASDL